MNNLYQDLELLSTCSFEDIKQQYRLLAKKHHPDMGGDAEKFKKIKLAYEVLSDPARRATYDKTGNYQAPPDIQLQARETLAQVFYSMLPNFDVQSQDILVLITNDIKAGIQMLNNNIHECNQHISKLEAIRSKIFSKKDATDNLFFSFIDSQLQTKLNDIDHFNTRLSVAKEMLKIVNNYTYGFLQINNQDSESSNQEEP